MRLIDLEPRWLSPNVFAFRCPCCQKFFLTCKNVKMSTRDQFDLFEKCFGPEWNMMVVPTQEDCAWTITSQDFAVMSVTPSIDASASGNWHGHITNGEIR